MAKIKSINHDSTKVTKNRKVFERENQENVINALIQESQYRSGWISVDEELPPEGSGISVVALMDDCDQCLVASHVMNSTWFNNNYKKDHFTHWMLLPQRPSTLKILSNYYFDKKQFDADENAIRKAIDDDIKKVRKENKEYEKQLKKEKK